VDTIDIIYKELIEARADIKANRDAVRTLHNDLSDLRTEFKLLKVRHGILGVLAVAVLAATTKIEDIGRWLISFLR
jgi:hypothetical protein